MKKLLKNKKLLAVLAVVLVLIVSAFLWFSGRGTDETDPNPSVSGGEEIAQDNSSTPEGGEKDAPSLSGEGLQTVPNDGSAPEDSVSAPSSWSEPEKEPADHYTDGNGSTGSGAVSTEGTAESGQQKQQHAAKEDEGGIPDGGSYAGNEPFGGIF